MAVMQNSAVSCEVSESWVVVFLSFPLVGNPSDFFRIIKKDSGQARMTEWMAPVANYRELQAKDSKEKFYEIPNRQTGKNNSCEI